MDLDSRRGLTLSLSLFLGCTHSHAPLGKSPSSILTSRLFDPGPGWTASVCRGSHFSLSLSLPPLPEFSIRKHSETNEQSRNVVRVHFRGLGWRDQFPGRDSISARSVLRAHTPNQPQAHKAVLGVDKDHACSIRVPNRTALDCAPYQDITPQEQETRTIGPLYRWPPRMKRRGKRMRWLRLQDLRSMYCSPCSPFVAGGGQESRTTRSEK